jgi:hypothetical protein
MRAASSLLAVLCSCNEVYGLDPTVRRDAAFFDAGIDAPHQCPPIGTPPMFSRQFRQVLTQPCVDFVVARTNRTLASCRDDDVSFKMFEGTLYQPMVLASGFDAPGTTFLYPRLSPDGETAIVRIQDAAGTVTFAEFVRGATAWTPRAQIPVAAIIATTSTTTNRHVLVGTLAGLQELVDAGNGFQATIMHGNAALGVAAISNYIHVTADGLRLLVVGTPAGQAGSQLLYSDRATDNAPFAAMQPLPELDYLVGGSFMTEDCAHMYFSGIGRVFATQPD